MHYEAGILHAEPGFTPRRWTSWSGVATASCAGSEMNLYFGGAQAARRDLGTGALSGAGDPRRGGAASWS